jgi:hypothetical protein
MAAGSVIFVAVANYIWKIGRYGGLPFELFFVYFNDVLSRKE